MASIYRYGKKLSAGLTADLDESAGMTAVKKRPTTSTNATPQKQQQTTMERYSASVPYDKDSKRYRDITQAVAYHIAKDMLPLSTVEKPGYKNLIHVLDPRYVIPGRKYFSKTANPKLYLI